MKTKTNLLVLAVLGAFLSLIACEMPDEGTAAKQPAPPSPQTPEPPKEPAVRYAITVLEAENGVIQCSRSTAAAGTTVQVTVTPQNAYRYQEGSLTIEPAVALTDSGGGVWDFTMPEAAVTIAADFELIPDHTITVADWGENGAVSLSGIEETGPYSGTAQEGSLITLTVAPDSGYRLADDGLRVLPEGAVTFERVAGEWAWTFAMADTDLEIAVEFAALGPLEIYKGGTRRGISVGELTEDKKLFIDSIDMESDEPGHDGNARAIKISAAINANGNGALQSFGLFSDVAIDMETVAALSFWARANKTLNIKFAGFGDADSRQRVIYAGAGNKQSIAIGAEWKRYVVPVPVARSGYRTTRVFCFGAQIGKDNYVCLDDIEFIESGVTLTAINIAPVNDGLFYGAAATAAILNGSPLTLTYLCDDGTVATLQGANSSYTLYYNLAHWLSPFIVAGGDGAYTVRIDGVTSNPMSARVIDGLLLDDFEDFESTTNVGIKGTPQPEAGYLWSTSAGTSVVVSRSYFTDEDEEIHRGLHAGNWRPTAASKNTRGGRMFEEAKDAAGYTTLTFWIKVTKQDTVFTFELRNGGALDVKTSGTYIAREFTYHTDSADGWQEVVMPLAYFVERGLDPSAITGYAFGVVDNQGSALRIMLDDIALVP